MIVKEAFCKVKEHSYHSINIKSQKVSFHLQYQMNNKSKILRKYLRMMKFFTKSDTMMKNTLKKVSFLKQKKSCVQLISEPVQIRGK